MYEVEIIMKKGGVKAASSIHDVLFHQIASHVREARKLSDSYDETEVIVAIKETVKFQATFRNKILHERIV